MMSLADLLKLIIAVYNGWLTAVSAWDARAYDVSLCHGVFPLQRLRVLQHATLHNGFAPMPLFWPMGVFS